MASKRRLRRKTCAGKKRYSSQEEAAGKLVQLRRNFSTYGQTHVYKCPFCGVWHLGHNPGAAHLELRAGAEMSHD